MACISRATSFIARSTTRTSHPGSGHPAVARWRRRSSSPANVTVDLSRAPVATSARDKSTVTFAGEEDRLRHRATAGWPLPGCEVRVVDLAMKDVARDMQAIGEIVIRGDNVMDGYYKEPQDTAE